MENKTNERSRDTDNQGRLREPNDETNRATDGSEPVATPRGDGDSDPNNNNEETGAEGVPTEDEIRAAEIAYIDDTEIVDGAISTPLYRRAYADFDPDETEVQLLEHFVYKSEELEKDGYF